MNKHNQDIPILLLVFNRPGLTDQVLKRIKSVAPKKLYVAADGPRDEAEVHVCIEVKDLINSVDWECEVKTLYREKNLGCGVAVSEGITWFFEQEQCGIILEDDVCHS